MVPSSETPGRHDPYDADQTVSRPDTIVTQFLESRRRGERPTIERFVTGTAEPQRKPLLLALIQAELSDRKSNEPLTTVEQYLERFPELGSVQSAPLPLIVAEYASRSKSGPSPDLAEYAAR